MVRKLLLGIFVCLLLYACNGVNPINGVFVKAPPYKKYIRSLEQAKLDKTVMVQKWIQAGESALNDSIYVALPFSESGYFNASEPGARSYRFNARKGQILTVNGAVVTNTNASFFLDLFQWKNNEWNPLTHGDSTFNLTHEFDEDYYQYLVRIQPELLVAAYYTINISLTPVLINPVSGATNKSIRSFYGDSRDGGKRKHEGVDIFAKKGTPVIAPTDGYISRVGTGKLGGKVVWMQDAKRGHSYYFAHLDSQIVKTGTKVKQGDLLGTVGNTGNARNTPSHLHFGIYQRKSIDPVHYLRTFEAAIKELPWDTTVRQPDFKVTAKSIPLRVGPGENHLETGLLKKDTYLQVIAQSHAWYRVLLPNNKQGFVPKNKIAPIQKGKRFRIKEATTLLSEIYSDAVPISHLKPSTPVEVLANFENFKYVRTGDGLFGWLVI